MSLKLSDARVYEPKVRARLGTTAHFCKEVVLELRAVRLGLWTIHWMVTPKTLFAVRGNYNTTGRDLVTRLAEGNIFRNVACVKLEGLGFRV